VGFRQAETPEPRIWNLYKSAVPRTIDFIAAHPHFRPANAEIAMLDTIFIVAGVGFFIVAILYEVACDRL
jgi:hypothetical protein